MFIDMHHFTGKLLPKLAPSVRHILEKIAILFIPLPLFMLFSGTTGIIEKESPEHLATISTMGSSFFNSLGMHSLIIAGAFGITVIVWFITRKFWNQSDEELKQDLNEHHLLEQELNESSAQNKVLKSDSQINR